MPPKYAGLANVFLVFPFPFTFPFINVYNLLDRADQRVFLGQIPICLEIHSVPRSLVEVR